MRNESQTRNAKEKEKEMAALARHVSIESSIREYNEGYRAGRAGRELPDDASDSYYEGWDAGNCDRPSLDELTLDVRKERTDPLGY